MRSLEKTTQLLEAVLIEHKEKKAHLHEELQELRWLLHVFIKMEVSVDGQHPDAITQDVAVTNNDSKAKTDMVDYDQWCNQSTVWVQWCECLGKLYQSTTLKLHINIYSNILYSGTKKTLELLD